MGTLTYRPYYSTGSLSYPGNAEQWSLPTYTQAPLCNYNPTHTLTVDGTLLPTTSFNQATNYGAPATWITFTDNTSSVLLDVFGLIDLTKCKTYALVYTVTLDDTVTG